MNKDELIKLYNEVTLSLVYTVEEKIKITNQILEDLKNIGD